MRKTLLVFIVGIAFGFPTPATTRLSAGQPTALPIVTEVPAICPDCIRGPWRFSRDAGEPMIQETEFEVIAGEYELAADSEVRGATVRVNGAIVLSLSGRPGRIPSTRLLLSGPTTLSVRLPIAGSVQLSLRAVETTTLPSCGPASARTLFDAPIVDPSQLQAVTPLGTVSPPLHTLPIHHINPRAVLGVDGRPIPVPVSAPGLVRMVAAVLNGIGASGEPDYSVYFRPCDEVRLYLIHLNGLSPRLQALTGDPAGWGVFGEILTSIDLSAGELIGTARSFDIGLVDTRQPVLGFVTRAWYEFTGIIPPGFERVIHEIAPERLFQFCALDYFTSSVADPLLALMGSRGVQRTASPLCGEHMLDVAGTAQGGWFGIDDAGTSVFPPDGSFDESNDFSFAPDSVNPSIFTFAFSSEVIPPPDGIPGLITEVGYSPVLFGGVVNRAPAAVLRDAGVYCFQNLKFRGGPGPGRLLVQVESVAPPDVERIRILYQAAPSTCGTGPWVVGPAAKVYRR